MALATLFKNNQNQAIRLPKSLEFPEGTKQVEVIQQGDALLITPADHSWDSWFQEDVASSDFMEQREQSADQTRDDLV